MNIHSRMTEIEVHALLRGMFDAFTDPTTKPERFAEFLTPDYIQRVDGKELDYAGFLEHSRALQGSIVSSSVKFDHVVTDGLSAATVHIAEAVKSNGNRILLKVIAYYKFTDGRISFVDELTQLLDGHADDRDLGSRMPH